MRWLFRGRHDDAANGSDRGRSARATARASQPEQAVLAFVRGYLAASGARLRVDGDDTLSATLPNGTTARYTTAPARADAQTHLLAPGDPELARMLDDARQHARMTWLRLPRVSDPLQLARDVVAPPDRDCGRCARNESAPQEDPDRDQPGIALCANCPLREGKIVLPVGGKMRAATVTREWEALGVELTYRLSARDRGGRTVEWLRLAHDAASGHRIEPLSLEQIERAQLRARPDEAEIASIAAMAALRQPFDAVQPALYAAGIFLRQRSADGHRARLADVRATHERLLREQPAAARQIAAELERELAALAEVHAVEVGATLEAICLVTTPTAEVRVRLSDGAELPLTLDLGRGRAVSSSGADGTVAGTATRAVDALTVAQLEALTPMLWRECSRWLLERAGYAVEPEGDGRAGEKGHMSGVGDVVLWRGRSGEREVVALGLRLPRGRLIGPAEVQRTADLAARQPGVQPVLISPSPASTEGRQAAAEQGVELWDREKLSTRLARIAGEHRTEEARAVRDAKERAAAAVKTRSALLDALHHASAPLARDAPGVGAGAPVVVGHGALSAAVAELTSAGQAAEQALLAWETLVADWLAAFAERQNRAGALEITADVPQLRALRERGVHLGKAMRQICERLSRTPAAGEMGYGEWRDAVIEAYRARLAAYRAQVESIDPEHWEDADRARSVVAQARADQASRAGKAAAARAAKSHAQVAQLWGRA